MSCSLCCCFKSNLLQTFYSINQTFLLSESFIESHLTCSSKYFKLFLSCSKVQVDSPSYGNKLIYLTLTVIVSMMIHKLILVTQKLELETLHWFQFQVSSKLQWQLFFNLNCMKLQVRLVSICKALLEFMIRVYVQTGMYHVSGESDWMCCNI